ncbi:MAG TPA: TetR/AcrR family transcriptional regulator [Magnetospirillaceae bacterium]|nr:TetR/AcrR family transcriptional regulator [Magnetospirillaceae bacterium]
MSNSDTARSILLAARSLLDEGGTSAVSMRKVAEQVGITAMAIYRHYPDHAALLIALSDQGFTEMAAVLQATPLAGDISDRLVAACEAYLDYALVNPRLFELMFLARRPGARQFPRDFKAGLSPTANLFAALVEQGIRAGDLRDDDVWEITFEMGALLQGLIMLYLGGRFDGGPEDFRLFYRRSLRRYIHGIHL